MKVCGIICEYNPFHNGHLHQITTLRKAGYDKIIAVMSGNFAQRGAPCCADKWQRTAWALQNGVDLVIELPVVFALSSAEGFARGAVRILNGLGAVDALCFGSEHESLALLRQTAAFLVEEPPLFRESLREYLRQGLSFPAARALAVENHIGQAAAELLRSPNAILGVEYIKALLQEKSAILPLPIPREASGYHSKTLSGGIASASAIRAALLQNKANQVRGTLPPEVYHSLCGGIIQEEDFALPILSLLRRETPESLRALPDVSEGLENRLFSAARSSGSLTALFMQAKSVRYPETRIRRICFNALLGISAARQRSGLKNGAPLYARMLGFRQSAADLLRRIKESASLPFISKAADYIKFPEIEPLFLLDAAATDQYSLALKTDREAGRDFTAPLVILP